MKLRRGSKIGKYLLVQRLGEGAFAEVWKSRDTVERSTVALKIALPEAVSQFGRQEIEQEAQVAARLNHPNILALRNADWVSKRFVIATDQAKCNLANYPKARRSGKEALSILRQVAAGLAHAHARKIIHRDIKPENILVFPDGRAAISDFGLSLLATGKSRTFTEVGTLGYMAPEQAYGRPSYSSDVFSWGLVAYHLLTGYLPRWPFDWPPAHHDTFLTKVPEPLRGVIRKAAQFDPKKRYPNAGSLYRAFEMGFARAQALSPAKKKPVVRRNKRNAKTPLQIESTLFQRKHGRALAMAYRCYRCDGPISESMKHCPWCGTGQNSFRFVSAFATVCPDCERGVRPEWTACPWCPTGRFRGNGRRPPQDPKAVRTCAREGCSGQIRPLMRYCPLCKRKVARAWKIKALPDRCPRCRWSVSKQSWRYCPWCGRREPRAGVFQGRKK